MTRTLGLLVLPLTTARVALIRVPPNYGFLLIKCNSVSRLGVLSGSCMSGSYGCRSKMILSTKFVSLRRSLRDGFSLVEFVLSLDVILVIRTLAIPVVVRSLQNYQLNSTLFVGDLDDPNSGHRAVISLPSGAVPI